MGLAQLMIVVEIPGSKLGFDINSDTTIVAMFNPNKLTLSRTVPWPDHDQARGGGHGMDHGTRTQMETAFGADFSGVRIHTDARADGLSQSLSARAFTTGRDVFFRQGEYNPGSSSGRELLAHELTHVVQQNGDGISRKMTVSEPGDVHEIEADQMARAVMQQERARSIDRQMTPPQEEEEQRPVATQRATDFLQRQPEAPTPQEEEERKRRMLQAKLDRATVSRRKDQPRPE